MIKNGESPTIFGDGARVYEYTGYSMSEAKNTTNYQTYGVLYNFVRASQVCPDGWHLPSDAEWTISVNYLGGESVAGGKMKEAGTVHWNSPNTGATNVSGFKVLPGGHIQTDGLYYEILKKAVFWSSTTNLNNAYYRILYYDNAKCELSLYSQSCHFSVRCIKND